jgi:hypothetical protein
MEEISIKVNDFNVYDLFKTGSEGGSSDAGVLLVQNLEKKTFKKFEFIDEKLKRADEENYKLKTEITNLKKFNDQTIKIIEDNHKEFFSSTEDLKKTNENLSNSLSLLKIKIEELEKELIEKITNEFSAIEENKERKIKDEIPIDNSENKKSLVLSVEELKMIKDNHKKITEIDKSLKLFISSSHIDSMKNDVSKLQEEIQTKVNSVDFENMKNQICKKFS